MAPESSPAVPPPLPHIPQGHEIVAIVQALNDERRNAIDRIVQTVNSSDACFNTVVAPIANLKNDQSGARAIIDALKYASPDAPTQQAVIDAQSLSGQEQSEPEKRSDYLKLVGIVEQKQEVLDEEDRKLLFTLSKCRNRGRDGALDKESAIKLAETERELALTCAHYCQNIRMYSIETLQFTEDELRGLSAQSIAKYPLDAGGNRSVPVERGAVTDVMTHGEVSDTRKKTATAWYNRLSENESLFKRAVQLRSRKAQILGYRSFAESVLEDRMAGSTDWLYELFDRLGEKMIPAGRDYLSRMQAKKSEHLQDNDAKIEPWDVLFYGHKLDAEMAIDHDEISEYFPLMHTLEAMLRLFASYFQFRLSKVPYEEAKSHVWSQEVDIWQIWDDRPENKGEFVGHLYVDIHGRSNKFKHNQTTNLQPSFIDSNGSRVLPMTTIMCNLGNIEKHGCLLLSHRQVQTLFHELGHCMHDLLARTKYSQFHGYEVKMEYGEAIASMLEYWIWMPDVLQALSCHFTRIDKTYETQWQAANPGLAVPPERIPDQYLKDLIKGRREKRISLHLHQLSDSMLDLTVHDPRDEQSLLNLDDTVLTEVYERLQRKYIGIERPDIGKIHTSYNHLMSGMEAGYYAYICANVFAAEMFESAFSDGRHNSVEAWSRFRDCILLPGGSKDEMRVIRKFLGRDPSPHTLLHNLGLD